MTRNEYQRAVRCFAPDPSLRERVAAAAEQGRRPRHVRPLRAALIAAALCLALVGTAVGARFVNVKMTQDENGVVWVSGEITYYPLEDLSDELNAMDGQDFSSRSFSSWEEVEEFIGLDIMQNSVLDESPESQLVVSVLSDLEDIDITGDYEISNVKIEMFARVFTDRFESDWDGKFLGITGLARKQTGRESYTTPAGLETELLTVDYGKDFTCFGALSLRGVPFVVITHSDISPVEAREVLVQVLDGFVLE